MFKSNKKEETSYSCTLSPEMQEKAAKELNEDPKTRLLEVKNLRTRLEKVPDGGGVDTTDSTFPLLVTGPKNADCPLLVRANVNCSLQPRTDVKFLLRFLRARKFDQERTFQLVKNYYDVRLQFPDMCNDLKPSRLRHVFDDGIVEVLKHRDNEGCRVVIFRTDIEIVRFAGEHAGSNYNHHLDCTGMQGDCNRVIDEQGVVFQPLSKTGIPNHYPMADTFKAVYVILAWILEEEDTQVSGVHLIGYLKSATLKQIAQFTPSIAKFFINILQDVIPMRLKRYDFVKEPAFWDVIFAMLKPFLKDKLVSRIVLNGDKFDQLHASIQPEFLPTDLGGQLPPHSYKEFIDNMLASDAQFEEDNKFGFVKMNVNSAKSVSSSVDADMQGLGGTFKKLGEL